MPTIICRGCKKRHQVTAPNAAPEETLQGSISCQCGAATAFKLVSDITMWVSGADTFGALSPNVPGAAQLLYAEAESCMHAGAPDGAAAMCRASIEIALTERGFGANTLFDQIGQARAATPTALDEIEVGLAHASRLITRGAIHRGTLVDLQDVPSMLAAATRVLNRLWP